jgi:hypothetical protein
MRIIVVALTLLSATLAGTTVYFARELELERERPRDAAVPVARANPFTPAPASRPAITARAIVPEGASPVVAAGDQEEQARKFEADQARRVLKILADPERREGLLAEYKLNMRNSYPRIAQVLGLSKEDAERLFTLLAQQQMASQEKYSRCMVDTACKIGDVDMNQTTPGAQEITELLGTERQQQFETYKNTLMERESVVQLRNRLPDTIRMPDATAEALIAVLADERQKIYVEASQRGVDMNGYGYGAGIGMVFSASDAPSPEAQLESARANSRRMRDRAAEVLNAEQLRAFDEMQEELMISMRNQVHRKEELNPAS